MTAEAKPLPLSEKAFRQQVVDLARVLGWEVYGTWMSLHSPRGFPDLVLCRPPRLLFVELKSARGVLTPDQERWQELLGKCGVEAFVWRPEDWAEVVEKLNQRRERNDTEPMGLPNGPGGGR